jgi:hypothetical protein
MATSVFRGFKIKGIDKNRLPSKEERNRRPKASTEPNAFRYPVYVLLEPIRNSDDDPLPKICSKIRRIWREEFNREAEQLVREHEKEHPCRHPDLPSIRLTYYDDGDCGEIRIYNTYLEEVKELISEPSRFNEIRKLRPLVEWVNKKTLRKL